MRSVVRRHLGFLRGVLLALLGVGLLASAAAGQPTSHRTGTAAVPAPILKFTGLEIYATPAGEFVRYRYAVTNRQAFPAELFAAAPSLPPCGTNTNSSRSWVDFFSDSGARLYGFCALGSPDKLDGLWFAVRRGEAPPRSVYIEIHDRQTGQKYRSNPAETAP